jgi:hypothetical protein
MKNCPIAASGGAANIRLSQKTGLVLVIPFFWSADQKSKRMQSGKYQLSSFWGYV